MIKLKRSGQIFFAFLALLLVLFILLIYTPQGLKLAQSLAERYVPELSIGHLDGTLHNFSADKIRYQSDGIDIEVNSLRFVLAGRCLLAAKACIDDVNINGVSANINTALLPRDNSQSSGEISLLRPVQLRGVKLDNVAITVDDDHYQIAHVFTGLAWVGRSLEFYPTQLDGFSVKLAQTKPLENSHQSLPLVEQFKQFSARLSQPLLNQLPKIELPLDLAINNLSGKDWLFAKGSESLIINKIGLVGNNKNQRIQIKSLSVDSSLGQLDIQGKARLNDNWPIDANLQFKSPQQALSLTINGDLKQKLAVTAKADGDNIAQLQLSASLGVKELPVDLKADIKQLSWPTKASAQLQLADTHLQLSGQLNHYQLTLEGLLSGHQIPETHLSLNALAGQDYLKITQLKGHLPKGGFSIEGQLN